MEEHGGVVGEWVPKWDVGGGDIDVGESDFDVGESDIDVGGWSDFYVD